MDKQTAKQEAFKFLQEKKVAVVCTASEKGEPHAATIFFIADEKFHIFFVTSSDTGKIRDIKENRRVALVVGSEDAPYSVQLSGTAEILDGAEALKTITNLTDIAAKIPLYWPPIARVTIDRLVAVKITPTWVRWIDLRAKSVSSEKNSDPMPFVQLIP